MIRGDSTEYEKLAEWVKTLPFYTESPAQIMTCEIGVREGLGSQIIMDGIRDETNDKRFFRISRI